MTHTVLLRPLDVAGNLGADKGASIVKLVRAMDEKPGTLCWGQRGGAVRPRSHPWKAQEISQ